MPPPRPPPPPFPIPPPPPIPIATILTKLTTMRPYLERTTDAKLLSHLSKVFKEVEDLYALWLKGFDPEMWLGPVEEDWDENAVESVHGDGSERSRSRDGSRSRSRSCSRLRTHSNDRSDGVHSYDGFRDVPRENDQAQAYNSDQGSRYQHSDHGVGTHRGEVSYEAPEDDHGRPGMFSNNRSDREDSDFDHDDRGRVDGYNPQYAGSTYSPPPALSPSPPAVQAIRALQEPEGFGFLPEPPLLPRLSPLPQSSFPNLHLSTAPLGVHGSSSPPLPKSQSQHSDPEPTFRIKGLASSLPLSSIAVPPSHVPSLPQSLPSHSLLPRALVAEPLPVAPQGSRKLRKRLQNAAHSARGENRALVDLEELGSGIVGSTQEGGMNVGGIMSIKGQGNVGGVVEPKVVEQEGGQSGKKLSIRGQGNGAEEFGEKKDMQRKQVPPVMPKARNMWDPIEEDG